MKHNTDCFCGIDFQRDYVSAVQYSLKERAVTHVSIQPFPAGKLTEEWKVWRRELKNGKPRLRFFCPSVSGAIPAQYAIIKLLTVDADEPSVEDALKWQLTQHLVGEPEDFVFDAQEMTGIATERTRTFLLAAYRRTLVEQTADMIRNAGFKPLAIGLDIFGLINVFEANYRERLSVPCLLVHCEEAITKIVLSRGGGFLDFHCFNNHHDATDEKSFAAAVASEIKRFCRDRTPEPIYATGSWFQQIRRRETFFETVTGAELLNPFRDVTCQIVINDQQLREYATQLAVAVGLALQQASAFAEAGLAASRSKVREVAA
jgi:Tfp pilus assembly PilM family ATPase